MQNFPHARHYPENPAYNNLITYSKNYYYPHYTDEETEGQKLAQGHTNSNGTRI